MLLKAGEIIVEIPIKQNTQTIFLDTLNEGSCFCTYSSFSEDL